MGGQPLHLLDLPAEILSQILLPLLTAGGPIPLCPCSRAAAAEGLPPGTALSILLAHPRLHAVACPILYGPVNEFLLDLTGEHHAHVRRILAPTKPPAAASSAVRLGYAGASSDDGRGRDRDGDGGGGGGRGGLHQRLRVGYVAAEDEGLLLTTPGALRRIARLTVGVDRLRQWIHDTAVPLVSGMIMHGSLRQLDLGLATSSSGRAGLDGTGSAPPHRVCYTARGFSAPPLSGLVGLLADPDLWVARMWVEADHDKAWCRFHEDEGGPSGREDEEETTRGEGRATRDAPCSWARKKRTAVTGTPWQDPDGRGSDVGHGVGIGIGSMVVPVDWQRIVAEVDPEGETVPVAADRIG
jgi:hypothetical protein